MSETAMYISEENGHLFSGIWTGRTFFQAAWKQANTAWVQGCGKHKSEEKQEKSRFSVRDKNILTFKKFEVFTKFRK